MGTYPASVQGRHILSIGFGGPVWWMFGHVRGLNLVFELPLDRASLFHIRNCVPDCKSVLGLNWTMLQHLQPWLALICLLASRCMFFKAS
jgi:hypothetical protein